MSKICKFWPPLLYDHSDVKNDVIFVKVLSNCQSCQTVDPTRHLMNINLMLQLLVKIRFCDSIRNSKFHCVDRRFQFIAETGRRKKENNTR